MDLIELTHRIRPKYLPFIAIFFSIIVLLIFWKIVPGGSFNQNDKGDFDYFYLPVGQNIAHGQGITLHGKAALDYPPGYPIIVAASLRLAKLMGCGDELIFRLTIVLLFAMGALLIFWLAGKIWDPYQALLASAAWSCYPVVLWATKQPSTELPFSVILYATLLCTLGAWLSTKRNALLFVIAGILCGFSMLIRPITIGLGVVFAVLILFGRRYHPRKRIVFALCLVAGNLATVLPWEVWAYSKTHEIILLSSNTRASISLFDGLAFAVWNPEGLRKGITVPADVKELMTEAVEKYLRNIETTPPRELRRFLIEKFKTKPLTVIKLMAIKTVRSWYGTFSNRFETPIALVQIVYVLLLVWATVLLWRKRPDCHFMLIAGIAVLGYFWGLTICVDPLVRYMMPALGALIIFFPAIPAFFNCPPGEKDVMTKKTTITTR